MCGFAYSEQNNRNIALCLHHGYGISIYIRFAKTVKNKVITDIKYVISINISYNMHKLGV